MCKPGVGGGSRRGEGGAAGRCCVNLGGGVRLGGDV